MFNEVVLVKPTYFKEIGNKQTFDKNDKPNLFLQPIAGRIPNKAMVVAGTVAIANGLMFEDGSLPTGMQLVIINETESDATFGRQFSVSGLVQSVTDGREILNYRKELSAPTVIDIEAPQTQDENTGGKDTPNLNTSALKTGPKAEEKKTA